MPPTSPLSLDTEYSVGEATFAEIVANVSALRPRSIVEFGAGASSIRIALAFPTSQVLSIDHDARFYAQTIAKLQALGEPPSNLELHLRPIQRQRFGGYLYKSYACGEFPLAVDAVIVDGPPFWVSRGREACLHQVATSLRVGARVYLDDTKRPAESQISANWLRSYRGLKRIAVLDVGHGMHVFEVTSPLVSPMFHPSVVLDHFACLLAEFRSRVSSVLRILVNG